MSNDEQSPLTPGSPEEAAATAPEAPESLTPPSATPEGDAAPRYAPPTPSSENPLAPSTPPTYAPPLHSGTSEPQEPLTGVPSSQEPAPAQPQHHQAPSFNAAPPAPPAPPAAQASGVVQNQKTNICAILSLVFAFVFSLAGIVLGHIALSQIKKTGEQGRGLALAGTILSYVFTVLGLVVLIAYIAFIAAIVGSGNSFEYSY